MVRLHGPSACSAEEAAVQPETKYARLGRDRVAYQVLGEGPPDLVMTTGSFSHVDMVWEDPGADPGQRRRQVPGRRRLSDRGAR
jgi:hypothetical protein